MNRRSLFDPEHLRIAAEVRKKAWRRRWFNQAGALVLLLIIAVALPVFALAPIIVLLQF